MKYPLSEDNPENISYKDTMLAIVKNTIRLSEHEKKRYDNEKIKAMDVKDMSPVAAEEAAVAEPEERKTSISMMC